MFIKSYGVVLFILKAFADVVKLTGIFVTK